MLHYGDPDWYERYARPFRDAFVRPDLKDNVCPRSYFVTVNGHFLT